MENALPHGLAEVRKDFGDILIRRQRDHEGKWGPWSVVTPGWEVRNMTKAIIPGFPRIVYIHKALEAPLSRAMVKAVASRALGLDGLPYRLREVSTFAPRPKRVVSFGEVSELDAASGLLSVHSWGAAVDLNPDDNPLVEGRREPPKVGERDGRGKLLRDLPDAWVEAFQGEGLTCGLYFMRPDSMHVQACSGY